MAPLLAAALLTACARPPVATASTATATAEHTTASSTTATADSNSVTERVTFHQYHAPADSASAWMQVTPSAPTNQVVAQQVAAGSKRANVTLSVTPGGRVTARCRCEGWRDSVATLQRTVTQLRRETGQHVRIQYRDRWRDRVVKQLVPVPRPVRWYDWGARIVAGVVGLLGLILALLFLAYRHRKAGTAPPGNG